MSAAENTTSASTTVVSSQQPPPPPGEWLYSNVVQSNTQSNAASVQPMAWQTAQANYYSVPPPVPQPLPAASYVPQPWPPNGQNPAMSISQRAPSQSSASNIPQTQPRNMTPLPPTMNPVYVPHYYAQAPGTDQQYMVPHPPWMGYHNAYYPIPPPHAIPVPQPLQSTGSTQTSSQADFPSYPSAMDVQNYQEQYQFQNNHVKRNKRSHEALEDEVPDLIPTSRNLGCRMSSEEAPAKRKRRVKTLNSVTNMNWKEICESVAEMSYNLLVRHSDIVHLTNMNSSLNLFIKWSALHENLLPLSISDNELEAIELEDIEINRKFTLSKPNLKGSVANHVRKSTVLHLQIHEIIKESKKKTTSSFPNCVQTDSSSTMFDCTEPNTVLMKVSTDSKSIQTDVSYNENDSRSSEQSNCKSVQTTEVLNSLRYSRYLLRQQKLKFERFTVLADQNVHFRFIATMRNNFAITRCQPIEQRRKIADLLTVGKVKPSENLLPFVIDSNRRPKCNTLIYYQHSLNENFDRAYFTSKVHTAFDKNFNIKHLRNLLSSLNSLKHLNCLNIDFNDLLIIYFISQKETLYKSFINDVADMFGYARIRKCQLALFYVQEESGDVAMQVRDIEGFPHVYVIKSREFEVLELSIERFSISNLIYIDIIMNRSVRNRSIMVDERLAIDILIQLQSLETLNPKADYSEISKFSVACTTESKDAALSHIQKNWHVLNASLNEVCTEDGWPELNIESPTYHYHQSVQNVLRDVCMAVELKYLTDFRNEIFEPNHVPEVKPYSALWILAIFLTKDKNLELPIKNKKLKELVKECVFEIAVCVESTKLKGFLLSRTIVSQLTSESGKYAAHKLEKYFFKLLRKENDCCRIPATIISHKVGVAFDDIHIFSDESKKHLWGITWHSRFKPVDDKYSPLSSKHMLNGVRFSTKDYFALTKIYNIVEKNTKLFSLLGNNYPEHPFPKPKDPY